MPHLRLRLALERLKKSLQFSRVVSIQGARQTGKSVLARELFRSGVYTTFDKSEEREEATSRLGLYLESLQNRAGRKTVVIDEAQKVPEIFSQIKAIVDEDPRPGQFLLLGSTEFSIEAKINESLTGRISRTRLFPLVLSETLAVRQGALKRLGHDMGAGIVRADLARFLENGGFPAIFSIRDAQERVGRIDEWVRLTCERDVMQIRGLRPDPEICSRVLETLPFLEEPTSAALASRLRKSPKKIQTQLKALQQIFALHRVDPHPLSSGKSLYYLIDPSIASFLGGGFRSRLDSALITEFFAKCSYQAVHPCRFSYYRGAKGGRIPLLIELGSRKIIALKWLEDEKVDRRELAIFKGFSEKMKREGIECESIALGGILRKTVVDDVKVLPWEAAF